MGGAAHTASAQRYILLCWAKKWCGGNNRHESHGLSDSPALPASVEADGVFRIPSQ
jgi:hypothetical protein